MLWVTPDVMKKRHVQHTVIILPRGSFLLNYCSLFGKKLQLISKTAKINFFFSQKLLKIRQSWILLSLSIADKGYKDMILKYCYLTEKHITFFKFLPNVIVMPKNRFFFSTFQRLKMNEKNLLFFFFFKLCLMMSSNASKHNSPSHMLVSNGSLKWFEVVTFIVMSASRRPPRCKLALMCSFHGCMYRYRLISVSETSTWTISGDILSVISNHHRDLLVVTEQVTSDHIVIQSVFHLGQRFRSSAAVGHQLETNSSGSQPPRQLIIRNVTQSVRSHDRPWRSWGRSRC